MSAPGRFARAWAELIGRGVHELVLGDVVLVAPGPGRVVGRRADGVRFEVDPADGAVSSIAPDGVATPSYDDLDDLIRTHYRPAQDRAGLGQALARVDRYDAYFAPGQREVTRAAADAEVAAGRIGVAPVEHVPEAAVDVISPDGRWRLETTAVRTRKIDTSTGDATTVLEGWRQLAPAWLPDDQLCVLCAEGEVDLDLADPEIGSLHTLREAFPGPDRVVRVGSSGLLHVISAAGDILYHVKVDADRVDGCPGRRVVVLTRSRPEDPRQWRTAILVATPAGLAIVAKHRADIGRLVVDGDRLLGSHGFELLGVDAALAAAGAWRTPAIADGIELERPPPPPAATLSLAPTTDLTLVRVEGARAPRRPTLAEVGIDDARFGGVTRADVAADGTRCTVAAGGVVRDVDLATGRDEEVWRSWPPVISVGRGAREAWALLRLHLAHCEVIRLEWQGDAWIRTASLPVEGFDRLHVGDGGRLVVVTIDNAPPEMAWSMFVAVDADGVLRNLGRLHHVVTAMWDADDGVHVELLGGHVHRVEGLGAAVAAARAAEPRPLRALVFDVPGHYGRREFLPRHGHDVGFIDRDGKLVIDHQFTSAHDFEAGVVRAAHVGPRLFGLVDRDGRLVVPHHYSWIGELRGGCRRIGRGEPDILGKAPGQALWGLLGDDGAVVLAPDAVTVRDMAEGRAAVERHAGRWNLVTRDGEMLLAEDADGCGSFGDGLCPVRRGELWGYVDLAGGWAIEPRFRRAVDFAGGRAWVTEPGDDRWRLLDPRGRWAGDVRCDEAGALRAGFARIAIDGRWGFVDAEGGIVIAPRFDHAFDFHDGLASVRVGEQWTWVDAGGRLLGEARFDRAYDFSGGVAVYQRGAFFGYVSTSGDVIADGFEDAGALAEERAAVCQRARWGFIDRTGQLVVRPRFTSVRGFSEGLAVVRTGGRWGAIDAAGAVVVPPTLGTLGSFHDGRARVERTG